MPEKERGGVHLWLVMMKAHRALAAHASRSIESLDMCLSDFAVLELLLHRGPQPVNTIGKRIDLTSGSITTAVDRLEQRGLVQRNTDKADRRTRVVSLTAEGRAQIRKAFAHHQRSMEQAVAGLTETERDTVIALLKKLGLGAEAMLTESARRN